MPELDGLRAIAVAAVIVAHYTPSYYALKTILPWGALGVSLFFSLSGFLITGILLRARAAVERGDATRSGVLKSFYARRVLRIFPVFYLALLIGVVADLPGFRGLWPWHATFTTNVLGLWPEIDRGSATHFWTLAVEEQFYLALPWLIMFLPRRALLPALVLAFVAGPVSRAATGTFVPTIGFLDQLAAGALLAYASDPHFGSESFRRRGLIAATILGLPLMALSTDPWGAALLGSAHKTLQHLSWALVFTALVAGASRGLPWALGRVMRTRPLTSVGKVSYGVYVYHFLVPTLLPALTVAAGFTYPSDPKLTIPLHLLATAAMTAASWCVLERPLLRLKDRFGYHGQRDAASTAIPMPQAQRAAA
jgi:peptidoglycan/LPS O-acetylase OafA/YrhL